MNTFDELTLGDTVKTKVLRNEKEIFIEGEITKSFKQIKF